MPPQPVDIAALCAGKKVVIFGLPGAFTPTCSGSHVPGYLKNYDALKAKGVDAIVCMAVNYMEDGTLPQKPAINAFHKAATAVIGDGGVRVGGDTLLISARVADG